MSHLSNEPSSRPRPQKTEGTAARTPMRWLALIGLAVFLTAPAFPALNLADRGSYDGLTLLLIGWLGVLGCDSNAIGWLANPCFAFGTAALLLGAPKAARWSLVVAAVFALLSAFIKVVPLDEAGNTDTVQGFLAGFWLWQTAIWFNLLVAVLVNLRDSQSRQATNDSA